MDGWIIHKKNTEQRSYFLCCLIWKHRGFAMKCGSFQPTLQHISRIWVWLLFHHCLRSESLRAVKWLSKPGLSETAKIFMLHKCALGRLIECFYKKKNWCALDDFTLSTLYFKKHLLLRVNSSVWTSSLPQGLLRSYLVLSASTCIHCLSRSPRASLLLHCYCAISYPVKWQNMTTLTSPQGEDEGG